MRFDDRRQQLGRRGAARGEHDRRRDPSPSPTPRATKPAERSSSTTLIDNSGRAASATASGVDRLPGRDHRVGRARRGSTRRRSWRRTRPVRSCADGPPDSRARLYADRRVVGRDRVPPAARSATRSSRSTRPATAAITTRTSGLWKGADLLAAEGGAGTWVGYSMGGRLALHVALSASRTRRAPRTRRRDARDRSRGRTNRTPGRGRIARRGTRARRARRVPVAAGSRSRCSPRCPTTTPASTPAARTPLRASPPACD